MYAPVMEMINASKQLLVDTINGDAEAVADAEGALQQIKDRRYDDLPEHYRGVIPFCYCE